jgi:hypothetical protein
MYVLMLPWERLLTTIMVASGKVSTKTDQATEKSSSGGSGVDEGYVKKLDDELELCNGTTHRDRSEVVADGRETRKFRGSKFQSCGGREIGSAVNDRYDGARYNSDIHNHITQPHEQYHH